MSTPHEKLDNIKTYLQLLRMSLLYKSFMTLKLCDITTMTLSLPRKGWLGLRCSTWWKSGDPVGKVVRHRAAGHAKWGCGRHIKPEKFPPSESSLIHLAMKLSPRRRVHREQSCKATLFSCTRALLWSLEP